MRHELCKPGRWPSGWDPHSGLTRFQASRPPYTAIASPGSRATPCALAMSSQFPAVDRLFLGYEGLAPEFGHVQQHAPSDDAFFPVLHRSPNGPVEGDDIVGVAAIPHAVAVPHVAQSVQMGGGLAVVGDSVEVGRRAAGLAPDVAFQVVDRRRGVVGRRGLGEFPAQGNGLAGLYQPGGSSTLFRRDHVDRAHLVFVAPAPPVAVFFQVGQNFLFGWYSALQVPSLLCLPVCRFLTGSIRLPAAASGPGHRSCPTVPRSCLQRSGE